MQISIFETGKIIKERRIMLGYSQQKLADGIMNVSNLSKLENGTQVPQKENLDLLLQRLGIDEPTLLVDALNKLEQMLYEEKRLLDTHLYNNKNREANKIIKKLLTMPEFTELPKNKINYQYLLRSKVMVLVNKNQFSKIKPIMLKAISLTIPNFSEETIADGLYSRCETELINILAVSYAELNNRPKAIQLFKALIQSLKKSRLEIKLRTPAFPMIMYNLSKYLSLDESYTEALTECNNTIDLCYEYGNVDFLPDIYYNKATILFKMAKVADCRKVLEFTCALLYEMKMTDKLNKIIERAENNFAINLCENKELLFNVVEEEQL